MGDQPFGALEGTDEKDIKRGLHGVFDHPSAERTGGGCALGPGFSLSVGPHVPNAATATVVDLGTESIGFQSPTAMLGKDVSEDSVIISYE